VLGLAPAVAEFFANQAQLVSTLAGQSARQKVEYESLRAALEIAQAQNRTSALRGAVDSCISGIQPQTTVAAKRAGQFKPLARIVLLAEAVAHDLPDSAQKDELNQLLLAAGRYVRLHLCCLNLIDSTEWDTINAYWDLMCPNCEHPKDKFTSIDFSVVQSKVLHLALDIANKPKGHKHSNANRGSKEKAEASKSKTDKRQRTEKDKGTV
jgi:hypothetical protein